MPSKEIEWKCYTEMGSPIYSEENELITTKESLKEGDLIRFNKNWSLTGPVKWHEGFFSIDSGKLSYLITWDYTNRENGVYCWKHTGTINLDAVKKIELYIKC